MGTRFLFLASVLLFSALAVRSPAGEDTEIYVPKENEKSIAVIAFESADGQIADRVRRFLCMTFAVPVRIKKVQTSAPKSVDELVAVVHKTRTDPDVLCLAVANPKAKADYACCALVKDRIAIVNLRELATSDLSNDKSENAVEALRRRVERESSRLIAELAGVKSCAFPLCVLNLNEEKRQLFDSPRNPCPHCSEQVQKGLAKMGLGILNE